ncbi:hypothetical protein BDF22DRAFT_731309 [Syncephalis plumigaleata]|nr:hypothetical protein BDF22DRAFT_731309 [Syncephalis plumigaleata]
MERIDNGNNRAHFCGSRSEYAALQSINWRQAYADRRKVEENWCDEGRYKELTYSGYRGHVSASNLPLKVSAKQYLTTTAATTIADDDDTSTGNSTFAEMLVDISNPVKSVISMPSELPHTHRYHHCPLTSIRLIFTNGYYTGVDFNGKFLVRPTYSEDDWTSIDVEGDLSVARICTLGRWLIMTWDESASSNSAWNLSTGRSYKLPYYIYRIAFIMSATEDRITIFSYVPSVVLKSLDWRQYQLIAGNNNADTLTTEKVRTGKFQCDHTYEVAHHRKSRSAFRLNPHQAVIQFDDCYMVIDLASGDPIYFPDPNGMPNCCPIIGRILWCHGEHGGQVRDVYSGKSCGFSVGRLNEEDEDDEDDQDSDSSSTSFVICSTFCISITASNNPTVYHFNTGTLFDMDV